MFKNNILIALRKIKRKSVLNLINILGLSLGLSICIIIYLHVINETGYDKYNNNRDNVYRLIRNFHPEGSESNFTTSYIEDELIDRLKNNYPEIDKIASIYKIRVDYSIRREAEKHKESKFCFSRADILDIFSFELLQGNRDDLLINNFDVLISESKSEFYFKNKNPIGKTLVLETLKDTILLTVKGVIKDLPRNSTLEIDFIGKVNNTYKHYYDNLYAEETYLLTNKNVDYLKLEKKLPTITYNDGAVMISSYKLQPLSDIYFHSDFISGYTKKTGNKRNIYILSIIAIVILLVSINNYIIFSIFDSKVIIKEIAIRKTLGASFFDLQIQQLVNSVIHTVIAFIVALLILYFMIPFWNQNFEIDLFFTLSSNPSCIIGLVIIVFLTSLLSGLYNSVYVNSLNPLFLFHSSAISIKRKNLFQRIIIAFQIFLFVLLTTFSIVVRNQVRFAINKKLGYNKINLLTVDFSNKELKEKYNTFKAEVFKLPFVKDVSGISHEIPNTDFYKIHFPKYNDRSQNVISNLIFVDKNFFKTMEIPFTNNSGQIIAAERNTYIINEFAVKNLGLQSTSKMPVSFPYDNTRKVIIKNICCNFDIQNVNHNQSSLAIGIRKSALNYILIRFKDNKPTDALTQIEYLFHRVVSDNYTFKATYLAERIERSYKKEKLFYKTILLGALLTILISSVGLLNISLLILKSRTKEILIRKILGANDISILKLLSNEIVKLIALANILAVPFSYFLINNWLQNYAQHINIKLDVYVISLSLSFLIMLIISTISVKVICSKEVSSELNR